VQLKDILKGKGGGKGTKGVAFLHDNAPAHRALATQKKLAYLGFQCLDHQPYSPSDYHLFPGLKKNNSKYRHFSSDAEVIAAAETRLDGQPSKLFLSALQKLEQRAKKYIELRAEYVDYIPSLVAAACFLPGRAKDLSALPYMYNSSWRILYKTVSRTEYNTLTNIWLPVPHITKPLSYNGMNFFVAKKKSNVTVNIAFVLKTLFRIGPGCHLAQSERIWVRRQCVVL